MFALVLVITLLLNLLLALICILLEIDKEHNGLGVIAFSNALAVTWFAWLALKAGITVEVLIK